MSFMILSSIVIPYSKHQCIENNQTNIQILGMQDHCGGNNSMVHSQNNTPILHKTACCLVDNGLIDIDVELIFSNLNSDITHHVIKTYIVNLLPKQVKLSPQKPRFFIADNWEETPIIIMQQSFLC